MRKVITSRTATLVCTALVGVAITSQASAQVYQAMSGPAKAAKPPAPLEIVIQPAAEPDPALRYRFWPAPDHRTHGNVMPFVNRSVLLTTQMLSQPDRSKELMELYESLQNPAEDRDIEKMRKFVRYGASALLQLEHAENLMDLDYDLQFENKSIGELLSLLLPEFQEMRQVARLLRFRMEVAIADKRWDDFAKDCRLSFRLSEAAGHSTELLIGRLIGIAIASTTMDAIEQAAQQPGAPSFYWAMAVVPANRLFSMRGPIEFESSTVRRVISLDELRDEPIGATEARHRIRQLADKVSEGLSVTDGTNADPAMLQLGSGVYVAAMSEPSREYLAETSSWGERAFDLSPPEAVLRATRMRLERVNDAWTKWSYLDPSHGPEFLDRSEEALEEAAKSDDPAIAIITLLAPAMKAASNAGTRTMQTRNRLLTIEAIRHYCETHAELPASLSDLSDLPAWPDPFTRKPFVYERTSPTTATIERAPRYSRDKEKIHTLKFFPPAATADASIE